MVIVGGVVGGVVAVILILAITAIIITVLVVLVVVMRGRQSKTQQEKYSDSTSYPCILTILFYQGHYSSEGAGEQ